MNSRDAIQQELKDLRSSLSLNVYEQPVFTVPEGYFENFAASVLAKIKSQPVANANDELSALSPMLAAISRQTPYQVPENYFSHLAIALPALADDDGALPGLLRNHTKQMPYTVPNGYFDTLAAQVAAKVAKPQAKVIPLHSRFARYAAAAAVVSVIALATFFYVGGNRSSLDPSKQPGAWVAQKLKGIPKSDIEAFLNTVDTGSNSKELAQKGAKTDVQSLLHDVSDTELDAFLKEVPTDAEISNIN